MNLDDVSPALLHEHLDHLQAHLAELHNMITLQYFSLHQPTQLQEQTQTQS
jgi:uncharacterized alpha-E superfamily protein